MSALILSSLLGLALQPLAAPPAQDPPRPAPPPVLPGGSLAQDQGEDEMRRLFAEVESRLRAVDRMLYDASAGRPLEGAEESGIDKLLQHSRDSSKEVVDGIDRIIDLALQRAKEQQQQGGGGGQQQPQQQGQSPLDQQRKGSPSERERTPEGQAQPEKDGQTPQDGKDSAGDPRNQPGAKPPDQDTERTQPGQGNDRWGDLPVHVRELFRVQGGDDLPPRYRDWIDAYYRRLNEHP